MIKLSSVMPADSESNFQMSPGVNELRDLSGKVLYVQILLVLTEGNFIESRMDISICNLNMQY